MVALRSLTDERYDRDEALGEARTYYGHPQPCDDEFWASVVAPRPEGEPRAALTPGVDETDSSSPSAAAEGLTAGSSPAQRFAWTGFFAFCVVAWFAVTALLVWLDIRETADHEALLDELWGDE